MLAKRLTFPLPHVRTFSARWNIVNDLAYQRHDFTVTCVSVASLRGTQRSVTTRGLAEVNERWSYSRPIYVVRIAGINYIRDGHHRATRAFNRGQKTIRAYVLEYNGVRA
jgi:hypothetical protein